MRNPLNKSILRELSRDKGKYIALFLFLVLTIGFVSGFLVADNSIKSAYDDSFEKYSVEDGHFTLATEADGALTGKIENIGVKISPMFYEDFDSEKNHTVRVYKQRNDVNKICLMDGKMPKSDKDIVIDRLYAENNSIKIGDKIKVGNGEFKVCGITAFSDYSALFKNNTDMMFDAKKFTVAAVTDKAFDEMIGDSVKYNYAWRNNDTSLDKDERTEISDKIKKTLIKSAIVTDFVRQEDNQAITFTGEDMGGDKIMVIVLLYIIMAVLAFVFGITTHSTIEQEASAIGTLRSSGYKRSEIVRRYLVLPIAVTLAAAVIGNILGYTCMKFTVSSLYYHSYSLPTYKTVWNSEAFMLTTVIPCLIVFAVVITVLLYLTRLSPLKFLRHELTVGKKKGVIRLRHFKFFTRFRMRVIFKNAFSYVTLFVGIVFASVLLMFGMMMAPLLSNFRDNVVTSKIADYQYILKTPCDSGYEKAEKYAVVSLQNDANEEITVYGIKNNSDYFDRDIERGEILFSEGLTEKYGIKQNDEIKLHEKYGDKEYSFKANGSYWYPASLALFMNIDDFNSKFGKDNDYYNGYFSDIKLDGIDEKYVATVITQNDMTVIADQLDDSMGPMFLMMCGFSAMIYVLLMYLLTKQIIEKNANAISMIKILGYTDREAVSLYSTATGIMTVISFAVSLPLSYVIIKVIYYIMMKSFSGWLTFYIAPWIWPAMFALGLACYMIVYFTQMRKIRSIPMGDVLKRGEDL